jgi:acylphosphatase
MAPAHPERDTTGPEAERRVRLLVRGRVQGVAYRAYTLDEARSAGVSGWVRNLPDGRVEAVFQGPAALVDRMVRWCHQGPPAARVSGVEAFEEEPLEEDEGSFVVRG